MRSWSTPRGGRIVDEDALIAVLKAERIAGAALDSYRNEPPQVQDPAVSDVLCQLDNVILASRKGGTTVDARSHRTSCVACFLVERIRTGRASPVLNAEVMPD